MEMGRVLAVEKVESDEILRQGHDISHGPCSMPRATQLHITSSKNAAHGGSPSALFIPKEKANAWAV